MEESMSSSSNARRQGPGGPVVECRTNGDLKVAVANNEGRLAYVTLLTFQTTVFMCGAGRFSSHLIVLCQLHITDSLQQLHVKAPYTLHP